MDAPNRNITWTRPSWQGHIPCNWSPPHPQPPTHPFDRTGAEGGRQDEALRTRGHRTLGRDLDVLTPAAGGPLRQGEQRPLGSISGGMQERLRHRWSDRWTVLVTAHGQMTGRGVDREISGRPISLRPGGAEGTDRHGDQSLIDGPEARQVDGDGSRLDHHVSRAAQSARAWLDRGHW